MELHVDQEGFLPPLAGTPAELVPGPWQFQLTFIPGTIFSMAGPALWNSLPLEVQLEVLMKRTKYEGEKMQFQTGEGGSSTGFKGEMNF